MSSLSMVGNLLAAAEELLLAKPRSAAFRRRAVSTAYYAVFHALVKLCAETLVPGSSANDVEYLRVYRALDHGPLANALLQTPLKEHPIFRTAGPSIIKLKEERHLADYLPPNKDVFPPHQVQALIDEAKLIIHMLQELQPTDRRLLATCLLFKERKS